MSDSTHFVRRIAAVCAVVTGLSILVGLSQPHSGEASAPSKMALVGGPISAIDSESGIQFQFTPIITSGLNQPLFVTHAGDDRLFVVEKGGKIKIFEGGALLPTPFLSQTVMSFRDRGLLGMAFEPGYTSTGRFYVYYVNTSNDINLTRYNVSVNDQNQADPASATLLLTIPHTTVIHHGGWIGFGPDQFLYVNVGDGGIQGDPTCRAQDVSTRLGKILRLDVIGQITYTVPSTNSFAAGQAPEVWAWGLRNPYRGSFDRLSGDLYISDVGLNSWEEIDFVPAGSSAGLNFGWNRWEGPSPFDSGTCPDNPPYVTPTISYSHAIGAAAISGYVYRGPSYPWLQGKYFYADWFVGKVFMAQKTLGGVLTSTMLSSAFGQTTLASWGEDAAGELYLADNFNNIIYRMESRIPTAFIPVTFR